MNHNPSSNGQGYRHPQSHHPQQHQQQTYSGVPGVPPQQHHLQHNQPYPHAQSGGPVNPSLPYHPQYSQQQQLPPPHAHHQLPHLAQMPSMTSNMNDMSNPMGHSINNMSMNGMSAMTGMGSHMGMPGHMMPQQPQQSRADPLEPVSLLHDGKIYSQVTSSIFYMMRF
ncbi:hypothetical protein E2P81_ATG00045 [Venturia nashicola]|uniref:Uncharacterized protein n=1 Tax=Venturia nashicola TaxID=86259 RepID=A0A4Z1PEE3_9PEZI|nr:hypothetical protein E6O75_ATG00050 [Venturia nashicola]TLD39058.1 hypothetical protein E2P81_ATG00045 [Venturia nashicola]